MCIRPYVVQRDCFKTVDSNYTEADLRALPDGFASIAPRIFPLSQNDTEKTTMIEKFMATSYKTCAVSFKGQEVAQLSYNKFIVPCRKCQECIMQKAMSLTTRAYCESLSHTKMCFLTLTYDNDHVGNNQLVYTDKESGPQRFIEALKERVYRETRTKAYHEFAKTVDPKLNYFQKKRLFKEYSKDKDYRVLTYLIVGEYGSKGGRKHWHALIFGWQPKEEDLVDYAKGRKTCPMLNEMWGQGHVDVDGVTAQSIAYVARYVQKKWKPEDDVPEDVYKRRRPRLRVDKEEFPECCYFSKKLSKAWVLSNIDKLLQDDYKIPIVSIKKDGGVESRMFCVPPSYYDWLKRLIRFDRKETRYVKRVRQIVYSKVSEEKLRRFFYERFKEACKQFDLFDYAKLVAKQVKYKMKNYMGMYPRRLEAEI